MHRVIDVTLNYIILILSLLIIQSCSSYQGDGQLTDRGWLAANDRYVLDLGPIDLNKIGKYQYKMTNLPPVDSVIGFEIFNRPPGTIQPANNHLINSQLKMVLTDSSGRVVVQHEGTMADWVWSSNSNDLTKLFVYRKGQEQERVMKNGVKKYNPAGIGIDGGWGTYFKPKKGQQYTLIVSIEKPDSIDSVYSARLLIKGGGWK